MINQNKKYTSRFLSFLASVRVIDILLIGSVTYLLLPLLIFFIGWLKPIFAFPITILTVYAGYIFTYRLRNYILTETYTLQVSKKIILAVLLLNLFILLISGVGGFLKWQSNDWFKHYAVLLDLINNSWPVIYEFNQISIPMVYSLAYYLPSAIVGKLSSWSLANISLLVWSFIGMNLVCFWYLALVRKPFFWLALIFLFFSGLDGVAVLVKIINFSLENSENITSFFSVFVNEIIKYTRLHLEWWAEFGNYPSNITSIFWAPQHAIGGWIATALFYIYLKQSISRSEVLVPIAASILFSPFVFVGLTFYLIFDIKTHWNMYFHKIKNVLSLPNLSCIGIIFVLGLYYISAFYSPPIFEGDLGIEIGISPFSFYKGPYGYAWRYFIFIILEVGIFLFLIRYFTNLSLSSSENSEFFLPWLF